RRDRFAQRLIAGAFSIQDHQCQSLFFHAISLGSKLRSIPEFIAQKRKKAVRAGGALRAVRKEKPARGSRAGEGGGSWYRLLFIFARFSKRDVNCKPRRLM
ncbi:hypothetical protein, partial [Mixta calida]|uniref:hypothetical protein n=1 Tax=Mixta calida TaxID=665913 RepID=UPI00289863BB